MIFVAALAALNHIRGGHLGGSLLPGHSRFWVAPAVAGAALLVAAPIQAVIFGLAFLAWSLVPWGHSIGLGRFAPDRKPAWLEEILIGHIENPWLRLFVIQMIGLLPAFFFVELLAPLFALAFVAAYEIAWRVRPKAPTQVAEPLVGALWAIMLVI
jgi:hypothetical protein